VTNPPAPIADPRIVSSMAERVAVLETRVVALKEDTSTIRSSVQGINNEMQRFVAVEMQCAEKLAKILEAIKDLPLVVAAVATFTEMRPEIRSLLTEREQRAGLAVFGRRFAMIVGAGVAMMTLLGGLGAGLVWLAHHLKPL
jgi:uncharacterized protein YgbK (DUF1537 family)